MRTIYRDNYDPVMGDYHEKIIIDEARGKRWMFDCDGVFLPFDEVEVVNEKGDSTRKAVSQKLFTDEIDRLDAEDTEIWNEIETIEAASDVVDVVGTYAELQQYDTSDLHDKDLIKVLQDETKDDAITYYRWSTTTETFSYVGEEGPYYTESQIDTMMAAKQDKTLKLFTAIIFSTPEQSYWGFQVSFGNFLTFTELANAYDEKTILVYEMGQTQYYKVVECEHTSSTAKLVMTDGTKFITYTYIPNPGSFHDFDDRTFTRSVTNVYSSAFTGATALADGTQGLVPAPTTADPEKFLKGDGTWSEVASVVDFYSPNAISEGSALTLYKDSGLTQQATYGDVLSALSKGIICINYTLGIETMKYYSRFSYISISGGTANFSFSVHCSNYKAFLFTNGGAVTITSDPFSVAPTVSEYTLPTAATNTLGGVKVGSNLSITSGVLSAKPMVGATSNSNGAEGYVPQPLIADRNKFLKGDGTWAEAGAIARYQITSPSSYPLSDASVTSATLGSGKTWQDVLYDVLLKKDVQILHSLGIEQYLYDVLLAEEESDGTTAKIVLAGGDGSLIIIEGYGATGTVTHVVVPKLYGTTGQNTDGAVTQKYFTQVVGDIETILQILNHGSGVTPPTP